MARPDDTRALAGAAIGRPGAVRVRHPHGRRRPALLREAAEAGSGILLLRLAERRDLGAER